MIKAEVVFDGDVVKTNGKKVIVSVDVKDGLACFFVGDKKFNYLEQAIKYCLEN